MTIRVVHFSKSPLAGCPIRAVQALQRHTNYDVRLVDTERWGIFDHDLVHKENPEASLELAEKADIIHLYNYLDYNSLDFYPIDFNALKRKGKVFVRHFYSSPMLVAELMGVNLSDVLNCPIPSLVVAHFQERFLPKARVVPNIVPQDDPLYLPTEDLPEYGVFFAPSSYRSAWEDRWNTKGTTETLAVLERVKHLTGCSIKWITGRPFAEVMKEKRKAFLTIDELVTGSFHTSSLESLALGKPSLAYLDNRTQRVVREISGSESCPIINVRLEDSLEAIVYLLHNPEEAAEIGRTSREWIEQYWSDRIFVDHITDIYNKLMENPALVCRQEHLRMDDRFHRFHTHVLPDLIYKARANRFKESAVESPENPEIIATSNADDSANRKKTDQSRMGGPLTLAWKKIRALIKL